MDQWQWWCGYLQHTVYVCHSVTAELWLSCTDIRVSAVLHCALSFPTSFGPDTFVSVFPHRDPYRETDMILQRFKNWCQVSWVVYKLIFWPTFKFVYISHTMAQLSFKWQCTYFDIFIRLVMQNTSMSQMWVHFAFCMCVQWWTVL